MPKVYVSIGSNINREVNLQLAITTLRERYESVELSPVYETPSVGFDGDPFYNLVAGFEDDRPVESVIQTLQDIEAGCGRDQSAPKFGSRSIDLDIILYGDLIRHDESVRLPRPELLKYNFMLKPLVDLVPHLVHPELNKTLAECGIEYLSSTLDYREIEIEF